MPNRKLRLSRAEGARYRTDLQELQAAGLEVTIPEESLENAGALDIFLAPREGNILRELSDGRTRCAIFAQLCGRASGLILTPPRIASEWDPDWIIPLGEEGELCRWFDFSWDDILNHRMEDGLRFHRPGAFTEGWLLAISQRPIPDNYPNRMGVALDIIFTDQSGHSYCARAEAILERRARRVDLTPRPREYRGLYEPPSHQGDARVHQTIANPLKSPTKPDQGRADETPGRMKKVAVGREHLDPG